MNFRLIASTLMIMIIMGTFSFAQDNTKEAEETENYDVTAEIELLKSDLKTAQISIYTDGMELTEAEGKNFWPIFNEYQEESGKLINIKVALIEKFADNYENMSDDMANELLSGVLDFDKKALKLQEKYIKKMKKVLPATKVARFYQLNNRIRMLLNLQVSSVIPLIK
jgi:hypothetical protein